MWYNRFMSVRAALALLCAGAIFAATGCTNGSDSEPVTPPPADGALAWATDKGVTVSVLSLTVEESSTTIVYYVTGRDDLGAGARVGEPITDQAGNMVMPRTSQIDREDPRRVSVTFAAIPHTQGTLHPGLSNVELWDPPNAASGKRLLGKWLIDLPYDGSVNPAKSVTVETGAAPFGPGTFELMGATIESGVLVVEGRIGGLTEIQAQAMHVSVLLTGPGGDFAPTNLRTGFGAGLSGLTARFTATPPAGRYSVRITMETPSHPYEPEAVTFLQQYTGVTAERSLDIP